MNERQAETNADRSYALAQAGAAQYIARHSGLYRRCADDEAQNLYQSWLPDQPLPTLALALSPNFAADGLILAGINGGVARSDDSGESWQALQFRIPPPLVTCLALSPAFESDGTALAGTYEDGIFRSADSGKSWAAVNFGLFDHNIFCLALSPQFAQDRLAFAGTGSGIYQSQNGGRLWQDLPMPTGEETVLSLALSPHGSIFAGTESHGLLVSPDGGASWERLSLSEGAVNALIWLQRAGGDTRLAALVDDRLLLSGDEGLTWNALAASGVQAMAPADEDALLVTLDDGNLRRVAF